MANRRQIDLEEATKLRDEEGWSMQRLADRYGVTRQAVSKALAGVGDTAEKLPAWPWRLAMHHVSTPSTTYRMMLAYRRHANGRAVAKKELADAVALRKFAEANDVAISYNPDDGFHWVSRRQEDGDAMFVTRE